MTPKSEKKLFLFDAFALIYRAYFAFAKNPRINSKGQDTSAILGLVNTLMDVQMKEQPTHWAICFDTSEPTERHLEYAEYKAQREAMPEGISSALPYIFKMMDALNIPVIAKPGFEADDVIGYQDEEDIPEDVPSKIARGSKMFFMSFVFCKYRANNFAENKNFF